MLPKQVFKVYPRGFHTARSRQYSQSFEPQAGNVYIFNTGFGGFQGLGSEGSGLRVSGFSWFSSWLKSELICTFAI